LSLCVGAESVFASLFIVIGFGFSAGLVFGAESLLLSRKLLLSFCPLNDMILTGSVNAFFFQARF